jgi:multidrug resistance efflux pump
VEAEDLADEIELLEAQLEGKKAELQEAAVRLEQARKDLARMAALGQAVTKRELSRAEAEVQVRQARLAVKRAQVREVEIKLKQAQRRLAKLPRRPADDKGKDSRPADTDRLRAVEKKLNELLKEVEALRGTAERNKKGGPSKR